MGLMHWHAVTPLGRVVENFYCKLMPRNLMIQRLGPYLPVFATSPTITHDERQSTPSSVTLLPYRPCNSGSRG